MPTIPQNEAGWRTEPPVSDPSPAGTAPAATSAAEPPDEPPGTRVLSKGWTARPYAECSVEDPIPNSSQLRPRLGAAAEAAMRPFPGRRRAASSLARLTDLPPQPDPASAPERTRPGTPAPACRARTRAATA